MVNEDTTKTDGQMNIAELQRKAHAIAKEKGWWDEPRTFGDLIALVHSELSEALEGYRGYRDTRPRRWMASGELEPGHCFAQVDSGEAYLKRYKPIGVPSELADVVIRLADMAEYYRVDLAGEIDALQLENDERDMTGRSFGDWIAGLHASLSFALAYREWDGFASAGLPSWDTCLADCVAGVQRMAAHYGIDLDAAIEQKMEYNRGREYRHGGKAL